MAPDRERRDASGEEELSRRVGRRPARRAPLLAVGIDAGGSKVRCVVADGDGRALGQATVRRPANVRRVGPAAALASAVRAARRALRAAGARPAGVAAIGAGFAGGADDRDRRALERGLSRAFPGARIAVATDAEVALLGALAGADGAVVVAGTGSIALAASGRRRARSGGWGPLLGDEGSGFDVGRAGLAAALRALDGRERPTRLARALPRALRVRGAAGLLAAWRRGRLTPETVASLAPLVAREAERGDAVAAGIVSRAGEELAVAAAAALRRIRLRRAAVALVGGLSVLEPVRRAFRTSLRARIPQVRVVEPREAPEHGAVRLALSRLRRPR